jgi:hypothetical protein
MHIFAKYTWGDFSLFIVCCLVLHYAVVGIVFYRQPFLDFINRKKSPSAGKVTPTPAFAGGDDDLVGPPTSYASGAGLPSEKLEVQSVVEPAAGASTNLTDGQEALVEGKLPSSAGANIPVDSDIKTEPEIQSFEDEEESEEIELDEVSDETKMKIRAVLDSENNNKDEGISENRPTFVENDNDIDYDAVAQRQDTLLEEYGVPIASSLNIIAPQASIFNADDVNSFLTELQDGPVENIPAQFSDTTLGLAESFALNKDSVSEEIDNLFAGMNM